MAAMSQKKTETNQPRSPLTFGVEFEFLVARFGNETDDAHLSDEDGWDKVARGLQTSLSANGFPATISSLEYTTWNIKRDYSVNNAGLEQHVDGHQVYGWHDVEVTTPILQFIPTDVKKVVDFCTLITSTYVTAVNASCGLHVHIGNAEGYRFADVQKFIALMYAFEPQFDTINPSQRYNGKFSLAMRESSRMACEHHRSTGRRLPAVEGVARILQTRSLRKLSELVEAQELRGSVAFRLDHLCLNAVTRGKVSKPTVESRAHVGTLDGAAVRAWIQTQAGIMQWCVDHSFAELLGLLENMHKEAWEKEGDGDDAAREQRLGPTVADGAFTVVQLLETMGLVDPARYYQERGLYKIVKTVPIDSRERKYSIHSDD